jgi:hypothetical protein
MVTWNLQRQLDLEVDLQVTEKRTKNNLETWRGICKAYKNPILESNVGQMSSKNKGKTCRAQVVSTTRSGKAWSMDWGSLEKA